MRGSTPKCIQIYLQRSLFPRDLEMLIMSVPLSCKYVFHPIWCARVNMSTYQPPPLATPHYYPTPPHSRRSTLVAWAMDCLLSQVQVHHSVHVDYSLFTIGVLRLTGESLDPSMYSTPPHTLSFAAF